MEPCKQKPSRTSALRIRVTSQEHEAITAAALAVGLGPCSFARMATVKAAGLKPAAAPRRKPRPDEIALAQWTGQLAKIGNVVNQLAHDHNVGWDVDPAAIDGVRQELVRLRTTVMNACSSGDG